MEKRLTNEQNIRSAIIFLNTFGLTLEEKDTIIDGEVLKVYSGDKEVGKVNINEDQFIIETASNFGLLKASYDIAKYSAFVDIESIVDEDYAKYAQWANEITYTIEQNDQIKMQGTFNVTCTADTEFGIKCLCHPTCTYYAKDGSQIEIKMQKDGSLFNYKYKKDEIKEDIDFDLFNPYLGYFHHTISKGEYENGKGWPYIEHYGVSDKSEKDNHLLVARDYITEYGNRTKYNSLEVEKVSKTDEDQLLKQKIELIQLVGKPAFKRIQSLIDFFKVERVSLIDNFINVSMAFYTDEEIKGLLGINRQKMTFQNGVDNLNDAYFGITDDNNFFLLGKVKLESKKLEKTLDTKRQQD